MAKLKDIIKENFSLVGGVVSVPAIGGAPSKGLTDIVEDIYGANSEKVSAKEIKEAMKTFSQLGRTLQTEKNLKEIANSLSTIATKAKTYTLSETEDWFDKVTVNRNMKELTNLSKSFNKIATEAQSLQERMSALYEDMGHVIGRYYEISDEDDHPEGHGEENIEEGDYEEFFQKAMDKFGIKSPAELDDDKKKEFFNYVDKNYKAKSEGNLSEAKFAVSFELGQGGDGTIIVDASGSGQAKAIVAKQLKKGLKAVKSVKRVQSGFGKQMDKKLGDD
jgi:hypothetical protein